MKGTKRELDDLLKKAAVPARPDDYWESFPGQVTRELRRREGQPLVDQRISWKLPTLAWVTGLTACIALAFTFGFWKGRGAGAEEERIASARKYFKEIEAMFPNQVRAIVLEKSGPRLVLSETANVPQSAPLYVKICRANNCQSFITFSGQQIDVNGEIYDVLIDGAGQVILTGKSMLWSSKDAAPKRASERIEARALDLKI
jgi:hypothetical protein